MLSSGNGRHRRPRPTPAAVVTVATAAATGAGIALPLLGAGSAQAADTGTWNKVAVCETGGNWTADTGNGFYGGLAITEDTWALYGGDTYAKRPDLATRDQQIAVAERVLADLGPNAWPGCETGTGLLTDTGPPGVDPTSTPVPDPSGPTGILPAPTTPAPAPSGTATTPPSTSLPADPTAPVTHPTGTHTTPPSAPVTTAPGQTDPTTPADGSQGQGRHGKPYSPTVEQLAAADQATRTEVFSIIEGLTGVTTGTPGISGHDSHKDTSHTSGNANYTVGSGDSLISIATGHHVDGGWHHLYDANHKVIGDDPNLIKPGEILNLG